MVISEKKNISFSVLFRLSEVLSSASNELNKSKEVIKSLEEQRQLIQEFLSIEHFTFDIDSKLARYVGKDATFLGSTGVSDLRGVLTVKFKTSEYVGNLKPRLDLLPLS